MPHEQRASFAQTQPPSRPQHVAGTADVGGADMLDVGLDVWAVIETEVMS